MSGNVKVAWYDDRVLEFIYRGEVTTADLEGMVADYTKAVKNRRPQIQMVDTLAVTSVPPNLGMFVGRVLEHYRAAGGSEVVMIADANFNRMMGRSMSFGAGIKLALFESRQAAIEHLRQAKRA